MTKDVKGIKSVRCISLAQMQHVFVSMYVDLVLLGPYGGQRQTCHSMNHGLGLRACCETLRGKCSVNRE